MNPSASRATPSGSLVLRCLEAAIVLTASAWVAHVVSGYVAVGHDQSWYLYAAKQMLHGVKLYGPHLEDSNPPLIYWLNTIPAFAAQALHLSISLCFFVFVASLAVGSAVWCCGLLANTSLCAYRLQRLAFASAILFAELNVQRATDFGQREQFMVILAMPYLIAFGVARTRPLARSHIVILGVVAALGFCVKPQQILTLFVVQLAIYALSRNARRLASPQTLAFAAIALVISVYVAAILFFWPQYPHRIMPLLQDAYWAFGQVPAYTMLAPRRFVLFVLLAALLLWRRWRTLSTMPVVLLAACVGSQLAFAAQRTGWYYQQIPRDAFLALFDLWVLIEIAGRLTLHRHDSAQPARWAGVAVASAAFFILYLGITKVGGIFTPILATTDTDTSATPFFDSLPPHTPVYVLSPVLAPAFPLVLQRDLIWASRAPHLMMLPAIIQNEWARDGGPPPGKLLAPARVEQMSSLLRANVTADLRYWHPTYVLVSVCNRGIGCQTIASPGFDMLGWFQRSPDFSTTWSGYRYERTILDTPRRMEWDVYRLASDSARPPQASPTN